MKRVDLIKAIEALGAVLVRHGSKHDWYRNPISGISQTVPRHREIKEHLARRIIRMLGDVDQTSNDARDADSPPPGGAGEDN